MAKRIVTLCITLVLLFGCAVGGHFAYKAIMEDVKDEVTTLIDER